MGRVTVCPCGRTYGICNSTLARRREYCSYTWVHEDREWHTFIRRPRNITDKEWKARIRAVAELLDDKLGSHSGPTHEESSEAA